MKAAGVALGLVVLAAAAVGRTSLAADADEGPVTLLADPWCPYNCEPGDGRPGFMIEIAEHALGADRVRYEKRPWTRAIEEARSGRAAGIVGAARDEAPGFAFPDVPIGIARFCFYVLADSPWRYEGVASLDDVRLGVIRGYVYGVELDRHIAAHRDDDAVQEVAGDAALPLNVKKLRRGRIDALVASEMVMRWHQRVEEIEDIVPAGCYERRQPVYVAFSPALPESPARARAVGETMRRLRASGELAAILARYGLEDWVTDPGDAP